MLGLPPLPWPDYYVRREQMQLPRRRQLHPLDGRPPMVHSGTFKFVCMLLLLLLLLLLLFV